MNISIKSSRLVASSILIFFMFGCVNTSSYVNGAKKESLILNARIYGDGQRIPTLGDEFYDYRTESVSEKAMQNILLTHFSNIKNKGWKGVNTVRKSGGIQHYKNGGNNINVSISSNYRIKHVSSHLRMVTVISYDFFVLIMCGGEEVVDTIWYSIEVDNSMEGVFSSNRYFYPSEEDLLSVSSVVVNYFIDALDNELTVDGPVEVHTFIPEKFKTLQFSFLNKSDLYQLRKCNGGK